MRAFTESQTKVLTDWVFNLRSGMFQPIQPCNQFFTTFNERCGCAIGVLGKMLNFTSRELGASITPKGSFLRFLLDDEDVQRADLLYKLTGLSAEELKCISNMFEGDDGIARHSFNQIADYIENTYLKISYPADQTTPGESQNVFRRYTCELQTD